jgi:spermidine synthase
MSRFRLAVLISGGAAVIGQTLVMREGLELFSGNELTMGLMIGGWILGTGLGSLLGVRRAESGDPGRVLSQRVGFSIAAVVFAVGFLRFAPRIFGLPFGEVIPLERMIPICFIALMPCGLALGAVFPAAARLIPPSEAYLQEGIGSFLGGLVCALVLIPFLPSLGILMILVILLIIAFCLACGRWSPVFLVLLPLLPLPGINRLEFALRRAITGRRELVSVLESKYGRSYVFRSGRQFDFYTSGIYDFSYPDKFRAEAAVHYPMLLHPDPRRVLLVGGGLAGGRSEILKHPSVRELICVELDPKFYRWAQKFAAAETLGGSRSRVVFGDARAYIMDTYDHFDVVILNVPDPVNGQLNRFYTREFFQETRTVLKPGGILSVGVSAPPDIIAPEYAEFLRSVRSSLAASFTHIRELPADRLLFIASDRDPAADAIADTLVRRIAERGIKTLYVREEYLRSNLSPEKLEYYRRILAPAEVRQNRDLDPICYYYALTLWSGMGSSPVKRILTGLSRLPPVFLFLPLLSILLFFRRRSLVYVSLAATGAIGLTLEIALLVLFQLKYGYVYAGVAGLIAAFMAGLAFGAWQYARKSARQVFPLRRLSDLSLINAGIIGLTILNMFFRPPVWIVDILLLLFAAGLINGLYFSTVLGVLDRKQAGLAYGLDLIGSSLAAFTVSVIFIPLAGVVATLIGAMALSLFTALGLRTVRE